MINDWRTWAAGALIGFWIWRVAAMDSPIGLILFATSAVLLVAGLLLMNAWGRAQRDAEA
ncbi:MAG TPA: hypothetical protein VJ925_03895 [Longimicrobiales bacterium]|nr:hypothetical protein [Longimicrobiales bacterium]